jgi:hypothetical protein
VQVVDQLPAGQGAPGLPGQRLQQREVLAGEGADVAQAVGDQQGPGHTGTGPQRGDHGVGDAAVTQRLAQRLVGDGGPEEHRLLGLDGSPEDGHGRAGVDGRAGRGLALAVQDRPERGPAGGKQGQLGPLGPQQLLGLGQDGGGHGPRPLGAGHDPGEVV